MLHLLPESIQEESPKAPVKKLVLVVDDHEDTRQLYRYALESHGYLVIEAAAGDEAVRMATERLPDLVLMDTSLPRVDGLMATRQMREQERLQDVPIVFVSGHAQPENRTQALAAGGNDYLIKPVSIKKLEATVEQQLMKASRVQL